ncbi:MAG TPA: PEP-CTERM sorting domain-containing protein [Lacipirellula sp.]
MNHRPPNQRSTSVAAVALAWLLGIGAAAASTVDRDYRFGDDALEGASAGVTLGSGPINVAPGRTLDSQGPSGAFLDIQVIGTPTHVSIIDRPDGVSGLGASFDGPGSGDFLRTPVSLNAPSHMWDSATFFPPADGIRDFSLNYEGILAHGIQAWVKPSALTQGVRQDIVIDTLEHGAYITASNNWGLLYNDFTIDSGAPVAFGQWAHVMELAGFNDPDDGRSNYGGALLVNGVAVAASGAVHTDSNFQLYSFNEGALSIGSNQAGDGNFYHGILDDVRLFFWGNNSRESAPPGEGNSGNRNGRDWGDLNLAEDNDWIANELADLGVTSPADVNLDGSVNMTDVAAFIPDFGSVRVVDNLQVGDWISRQNGDLNFDGAVDLNDAFILNDGLIGAGFTTGLDFSLLDGDLVPEPTALFQFVTVLLVFFASRLDGRRSAVNVRKRVARSIAYRAVWIGACVVLMGVAAADRVSAAPFNLAPEGDPILGAGVDFAGTDDVPIVASGIVGVVNDQDVAEPGPFDIRVGRSVDTFSGALSNAFDFVGVLFDAPVSGVNQVRVQNFAAKDGGWWGPTTTTQNGVPLGAGDLAAPNVQVTTDGGLTWATIPTTSTDYVTAFSGTVRGSGVPTSGATPPATFNFATQNGINGIRLIGNGGGSADSGPGFIGIIEFEVLQDLNVVFPTLDVNTATGALTLRTGPGTPRGIQGYSITSDPSIGALNPAAWRSISDNYDDSGNGSIDGDDDWTELSSPASNALLSETQLGGAPGNGGSLGAGLSLVLGNAGTWIPNPFGEDIRMEILLTDGQVRRAPVTYNGLAANPIHRGDFNGDGVINTADWPTVRDNFNANLAGMSLLQRYARGDLNDDGKNDRFDFTRFKELFDAENGAGAFLAMLSDQVPEPSALPMLAVGLGLVGRRFRKREFA